MLQQVSHHFCAAISEIQKMTAAVFLVWQPPCQKWLHLTVCVCLFILFFSGADPTRIIQGPVDMEIIVGESIVLPCQVTSDPVLDVSFSWAFNGQLIAKGDGHFELVGGVSDPPPFFLRTCKWAVGTFSHLASFHPRQ